MHYFSDSRGLFLLMTLYNCGHNPLELLDIVPNFSFAISEMERDY